ncbi:DUF2842 domain-containing protein [Coralliovum pocilloporae]|uniref:DUF2842 domain-containing protein n=1 Tax=Coralliovum pocilloporae TaxID=3066369 RepID=UPI003307BF1E
MKQRTRKFFGVILVLIWMIFYALLAMTIAVAKLPEASRLFELVYYALAGLLWTIPVAIIIKWMAKPDEEAADAEG